MELAVIYGPTASGKTALSLAIAERMGDVEIVSADSRQIYRELSIGTAKPTVAELEAVRHHCINIIDPSMRFSAGAFVDAASHAITDILSRGKRPLLVGGTGFYLRALFDGLGAPELDPTIAYELEQRVRDEGIEALFEELTLRDPKSAERIGPHNRVRIVRALGCLLQTGTTFSSFRSGSGSHRRWRPRYIVVRPDRMELYASIGARFGDMVARGLVDETARAIATYGVTAPALTGVGYREAVRFLEGEIDHSAMIEMGTQSTRRYAKRQYTWMTQLDRASTTTLDRADPVVAMRALFGV